MCKNIRALSCSYIHLEVIVVCLRQLCAACGQKWHEGLSSFLSLLLSRSVAASNQPTDRPAERVWRNMCTNTVISQTCNPVRLTSGTWPGGRGRAVGFREWAQKHELISARFYGRRSEGAKTGRNEYPFITAVFFLILLLLACFHPRCCVCYDRYSRARYEVPTSAPRSLRARGIQMRVGTLYLASEHVVKGIFFLLAASDHTNSKTIV